MSEPDSHDLERDVDRDWLNRAGVLAAVLLAGLELYDGLGPTWAGDVPASPSLFLAGVLLAGVGVFLTHYWRPALYVPAAVVGLYVVVVWLFGARSLQPTSLATIASAALLAVLSLLNFYREQVAYLSDEPAHTRDD